MPHIPVAPYSKWEINQPYLVQRVIKPQVARKGEIEKFLVPSTLINRLEVFLFLRALKFEPM